MIEIRREGSRFKVNMGCLERIGTFEVTWLKEVLMDQIRTEGNHVVVDIGTIRNIDRTGFGMLQDLTRNAMDSGSRFLLCNVTDEVRELILLHELEGDLVFCLCDNADERVHLDLG